MRETLKRSGLDAAAIGSVVMGNVIQAGNKMNPTLDRAAFSEWLRQQIAANRPWNEVVYDLVTAAGENRDHPATNWILRYTANPIDLTGKMSRLFLGVQIQCAQCHDHKTEKWKQSDFDKFANCFTRTQIAPIDRGV